MPRRLVLLAAGAALAFGVVPSQAAERPSGCAAFADAVGDAEAPPAALYRPPATEGVDIRSTSVRHAGEHLVVTVAVGDLTQQPASSVSTRVAFDFVLRGYAFRLYYTVGSTPQAVTDPLMGDKGIEVFDEKVSDRVRVSVAGSTVTFTVEYDELERLREKPVVGHAMTELDAHTTAYYLPDLGVGFYPRQDFDHLEAARGVTRVLGEPCAGSRR